MDKLRQAEEIENEQTVAAEIGEREKGEIS